MNSDIEQLASLAHSQLAHQTVESTPELSNGTKRKTEDDLTATGKSKRSRYISLACNECKRRKIKCNGQTPCQRCGNLNLECVYTPNCCSGFKDSQEFKEMTAHIVSLQEQVNALYDNINNLRAQLGQNAPLQPPPQPSIQHSQFQAIPTIDPSLQSQSYNDGSAYPSEPSMSLETQPRSQQQNPPTFRTTANADFSTERGSRAASHHTQENESTHLEVDEVNQQGQPIYKVNQMVPRAGQIYDHIHESKDPIWTITQEEAMRLCQVYEDATQLMYPVVDVNNVRLHVDKLFPFLVALRRSGLVQQGMAGADAVEDEHTNVLKLVLAIALDSEGGSHREVGKRFYEVVLPTIMAVPDSQLTVNDVRLRLLAVIYEIQQDSARFPISSLDNAANQCLKLDLHLRATYDAMDSENLRAETMLLFWTCYLLDRKWSVAKLGTQILDDDSIDSRILRPGDSAPYLVAMLRYSTIDDTIRENFVTVLANQAIAAEDIQAMEELDRRTLEWYHQLPHALQYERVNQSRSEAESLSDRAVWQAQLSLAIYRNSLRMSIYRLVLETSLFSEQYRDEVLPKVVEMARDTIRLLLDAHQRPDIYRPRQAVYDEASSPAFAWIMYAISFFPARFADSVRDEFHMALGLIRDARPSTFLSKGLWHFVSELRKASPLSHLATGEPNRTASVSRHEQQHNGSSNDVDSSRTAAVAMAGLAGHNVDETAFNTNNEAASEQAGDFLGIGDPTKAADFLARLFDTACNMPKSGQGRDDDASQDQTKAQERTSEQLTLASAIGEEKLANILSKMF